MKKVLITVIFLALNLSIGFTQTGDEQKIAGQWDFDDPADLTKATVGSALEVFGSPVSSTGPEEGNGAVLVGVGDYFKAPVEITPSGAGTRINTYTIVMDIKIDELNDYACLIQADLTNTSDGSLFLTSAKTIGNSNIGYSNPVVTVGKWIRMVFVSEEHSASDVSFDIYFDGSLVYNGNSQSVDRRLALRDSVFFFLDDNEEELPLNVAKIVLYNYALSSEEVAELGDAKTPEDQTPEETEFLTNSDFDDGLDGWGFYVNPACEATLDLDTTGQLVGKNSAHVRVDQLTSSVKRDYHIQFYQNIAAPNGIRPGYKYYLQYKVKVSKAISDFFVQIHRAYDPWTAYEPKYGYIGHSLEPNQAITILDSLEFADTDDHIKLNFALGLISDAGVDIWIDDVHLVEVKQAEIPEEDREPDLPDGTEKLTNNYFDDGLNNWELYSLDPARAEYELDTNSVITGENSVHVIVHNPYKDIPSGRIQLNQHNIPGGIIEGQYYFVSFNIKANKDIEKCFWNIYDEPDYNNYYKFGWVKAKRDEITHISEIFQADKTDNTVYFAIDFGALQNDDTEIWIDDVHLIEVEDPLVERSLPRGTIELLNNSYFDDGLNNWWINAIEDVASMSLSTNYILEGKNSVYIKVNNASGNSQTLNLYQRNLLDSVKTGTKYYVQFIAKANKDVSGLKWAVHRQDVTNATLYSKEFSLPAGQIVYVVDTIPAFSSKDKVLWSIDMGAIDQDDVHLWFDGIHFMEMGKIPDAVFPPETTWEPISPASLEKPGYMESVQDPKYGVTYTCVSDPTAFGISSGSGALLSNYPKIQAWNADMSLIALSFGKYILDGKDYSIYKQLPYYLTERRWSNVDPKIIYFCSGDQFKKINVETGQITTLHTFPGYSATIGPGEGSISADDKYVVITHQINWSAVAASLYDIELDSVIATKTFPEDGDIDWVTVPPSGDYIVVNDRGNRKIDVYDLNFNYLRTIGNGAEHGDFGVDSEGNEVWVQVIPVSMSRLSDGKYTKLLSQDGFGGHISGRGFNNPGWALVSTGDYQESSQTQLFEVKLDGSGIIRHFGYARSSCTTYDNYPMGSVSRDGKKVIFNSDWLYGTGSGGDAVAYISEYLEMPNAINDGGLIGKMEFELSQNYPNPFNPTTTINFKLNREGMTKLVVYNILGQKVKTLINETMRAGSYSVPFDGSGLSSGIYFYKLQTNNQIEIKRMLLIK